MLEDGADIVLCIRPKISGLILQEPIDKESQMQAFKAPRSSPRIYSSYDNSGVSSQEIFTGTPRNKGLLNDIENELLREDSALYFKFMRLNETEFNYILGFIIDDFQKMDTCTWKSIKSLSFMGKHQQTSNFFLTS